MFLPLAHTQLDVFTISKELVTICYRETQFFPKEERFALTQQIRRAAISVHLNLAEGCSRTSAVERNRFFEISRGSIVELDTAFDIAITLGYTNAENLQQFGQSAQKSFQILSKMIKR